MKSRLVPFALAAALLAGTGSSAAAPPGPVDPDPFEWPCPGFIAELTATGKFGVISLPGDRFKVIAPNQRVTIMNPESSKTVSYVITGVTHVQKIESDADYLNVTATGLNVILVPEANGHSAGLFFTKGKATWTLNLDGSERTLFSSQGGQVTDVCKLIA